MHSVMEDQRGGADVPALHRELQAKHSALLARLDHFGELTGAPLPQQAEIAEARWRLSRASRERWVLLEVRLIPVLRIMDGASGADLNRLVDDAKVHQIASAQHVARWPLRSIMLAWKDYCEASKLVQTRMRARIAQEQDVLIPALDRLTQRG